MWNTAIFDRFTIILVISIRNYDQRFESQNQKIALIKKKPKKKLQFFRSEAIAKVTVTSVLNDSILALHLKWFPRQQNNDLRDILIWNMMTTAERDKSVKLKWDLRPLKRLQLWPLTRLLTTIMAKKRRKWCNLICLYFLLMVRLSAWNPWIW